jgi:hypothetical protein
MARLFAINTRIFFGLAYLGQISARRNLHTFQDVSPFTHMSPVGQQRTSCAIAIYVCFQG